MVTRAIPADGQITSAMSSLALLDMSSLIAQPLHAVVDAQVELSLSTVKFLRDFALDASGESLRNVVISQNSVEVLRDADGNPVLTDGSLNYVTEQQILNLPLITLLNVPSLQIKKFTIDLTIELVSVQTISGEVETTSNGTSYDSWNNGGGSSGSYKSFVKGSSSERSSASATQAIKYALHLEAAVAQPPGLTMLLDFLVRNKKETANQIPLTTATGGGSIEI